MRDYKGILIAKGRKLEGQNLAPEVDRIWDALGPIDAFLRDMSSGMGRISNGQSPDSSGDPLGGPLLDEYFFLPGRVGGQVGYGDTVASGSLTLSSTRNSTKGKVYLGDGNLSAYDESGDRLGKGTVSPTAGLHVVHTPSDSYSRPVSTISNPGGFPWTSSAGGALYLDIDEPVHNDNTDWIRSSGQNGTFTVTFGLLPAIPITTSSLTVKLWVQRDTIHDATVGHGGTYILTLNRSDGSSAQSATFNVDNLPTTWTEIDIPISGFIGTSANTNRVSISQTSNAAGSNRIMITWLGVVITTSGVGGEAVTLFELGADNNLPFSIWRDEADNDVITIDEDGGVTIDPSDATAIALTLDAISGQNIRIPVDAAINKVLTSDADGDGTWQLTSALTVAEFVDSAFRIIGSVTPTKKLAFEVDGLSVGTRTLTPQDFDYIIAGLNIDEQRFTREQVFFPSVGDPWAITVREGPGGTGVARFLDNVGAAVLQINANDLTASQEFTFDDQITVNGASTFNALATFTASLTTTTGSDATFGDGNIFFNGTTGQGRFANGSGNDILFNADGTSDFTGLMTTQDVTHNGTLTATSTSIFQVAPRFDIASATTGYLWQSTDNDGNGVWANASTAADVARTWSTLQKFPDDMFEIIGSATPSKILRFEVDGLTAATTRTLTPQDASYVLAGTNITNSFSATQTFGRAVTIQPTSAETALLIKESSAGNPTIVEIQDDAGNQVALFPFDGQTILTSYGGAFPLILADDANAADVTFDVSLAGAGAAVAIPPGGGTMVTGASSTLLTNKTLGSGTYLRCGTASTNVRFGVTTSTTNYVRLDLTAVSGTPVWAGQNLTGAIPIVGDDAPAVAAGALGKVDLIGQTAAIGSTNLSNTPPAGIYKVDIYVACTTASGSGTPTLDVNLAWTDVVGATNRNATANPGATAFPLPLSTQGRSQATFVCQVASGNIAYTTTINSASGSPEYAIYIRVTALG